MWAFLLKPRMQFLHSAYSDMSKSNFAKPCNLSALSKKLKNQTTSTQEQIT